MLRLKKQDIFSGHWKAVWKKRLFFFLIKICLKGHFILVNTPLDYSCCKPSTNGQPQQDRDNRFQLRLNINLCIWSQCCAADHNNFTQN